MKRSDIVDNFSKDVLVDSVIDNWWEMIRIFSKTPYYEFYETSEYNIMTFYSNTKIDGGWCVNINTSPENIESTISKVLQFFEDRKISPMLMITPRAKPVELESNLIQNGFMKAIGNPAMYVELSELIIEKENPEELSLKPIINDSDMTIFRDIYYEGFEENRGFIDYMANSAKTIGYSIDSPIQFYLGYYEDEPIATSQMVYGAGVAGLFSVVVQPEYRGKGLGTAMTVETLLKAVPLGYKYAVLWATKMGVNIYRRLGFKELFYPEVFSKNGSH